ncbi:hypothetical protein LTR84_012651 [Exophiala bonariae]|uniref:Enoyl reductase (ER) domain-containing protein n=1 Tax=Exophiala bonariae TaxID=1690606 RepID=A0AAV9NEL8_9EURO|nr:hypothetical protein LTR84_012651 [Exophiala bonariae]
MQLVNYAAWIPSEKARLEVGTSPFPTHVAADEIVIKNHAVAVNPVDWKIQVSGGFGLRYPYILGDDVAGEVVEVGAAVKAAGTFKPGDRVIAHALGLGANNPQYGGFQLYPKLKIVTAAKIPDDIPPWNAVVLPLSVSTAAAGLYLKTNLGLKLPSVKTSTSSDIDIDSKPPPTLLLWGGSSSVGSSVIQLAVASGYRVIATASPSNYGYVKALGAALVLDYHNPDIETLLIAVLRAEGSGPLAGAYDAIGSEATVSVSARIVHALGGGRVTSVISIPSQPPHDVTTTRISSAAIVTQEEGRVARKVWGEFVPAALRTGVLKPRPDELIVGRGLYFVQAGLDKQREGVSARKVVVTL